MMKLWSFEGPCADPLAICMALVILQGWVNGAASSGDITLALMLKLLLLSSLLLQIPQVACT